MKLYYWPMTRALRIVLALEEMQVPYEVEKVDIPAGANRTPEFLALNPLGKVPVLVDGETVVAESGAILAYLADRYPQAGLAPSVDHPSRGRYLQWLFFATGVFEPAAIEKATGLEPNTKQRPWGDWDRVLAAIESALDAGPWLVGETFTMPDVLMGLSFDHLERIGMLPPNAKLSAYLERLRARPAYERTCAFERRELEALGRTPQPRG